MVKGVLRLGMIVFQTIMLRSGWQSRGREPRCARLDSRGRLSPH